MTPIMTFFTWPSINFWQRLLYSCAFIIFIGTFIGVSHIPHYEWLFIAGVAAIQFVASKEYVHLCHLKGFAPAATLLSRFSLGYLFIYSLATLYPKFAHLPMFVLIFGAMIMPFALANKQQGAIANLAVTLFGFVYIVFPLCCIIDINFLPHLPADSSTSFWITWLLVTTKGSDMAAYFSGKILGRHPLASALSPKKTIEGAIGGIIGAAALSASLHRFWHYASPQLPLGTWILLGCIVGVAAMIGDLSESLLKRDAGVKDSNSIPGLGGVLDIIDSVLLSAPLLYVYLRVMGVLGL